MSSKIYCLASFTPKNGKLNELSNRLKQLEPDTLREDGCISYIITKHIVNSFATGTSMPLVFNEVWRDKESFELHCQKDYIVNFFNNECLDKNGLVEKYNVTVYSDENV